jgi:hypothetical protein
MRYKLAEDAKPQVWLLLLATAITVLLWFLPLGEYIVYPIRLFVTFVHEGAHALAAFVTGGSVQSLTIGADGSGEVYSAGSGWFSSLITSSAGYLGTTAFGVLLLFLIRRSVKPNYVLYFCAAFVGVMTLVFGMISPAFNFLSLQVAFSTVAFTIVAGLLLTAGLLAMAKFASIRAANFAVAFLAIQCLLNSLSDLKNLFFINAPLVGSDIHTDAANMSALTGLPGIVWVVIWIGLSLLMISVGLRLYSVSRTGSSKNDTLFED